ncbi:LysR family transcriptional regulator [Phytoactinopolyspora halotolerans]|uniref:LysR family transcriptional regulator n=1 Tax=Phytoactinopolyspora halotolerans TaxID=1981512 RepID=A0A6L9S9E5_9ACTN|nr:LysR family transcriptional regulator [Phytoactinopolyspora halotolerans]NEE02005.1 LysR family transcriptional regulator [Phytoactinopolyspora halotolerans]
MRGGPGVELRQLRYFVTVAEELHFGRAAERLHIVQPAVSQQVRRLERELGVTLLDRSPRQVRLTRHGERLLPEARAAIAAADRVSAVAAGLSTAGRCVLKIGTGPGLSGRLVRGLEALRRLVPETEVEIDSRPVAEQLEAVRTGELDVALVRAGDDSPLVDAQTLRSTPLWREPVQVAITAAHPLANGVSVRLDQLAAVPARMPRDTCDPLIRGFFLDACRRAGFEPRVGRPAGALHDTLLELGAGSPAWTFVYGDAAGLAGTDRVAVLPVEPVPTITGSLITSATRSTACVEVLRHAFSTGQPALPAPALTAPVVS